jgi:hypothetical protein
MNLTVCPSESVRAGLRNRSLCCDRVMVEAGPVALRAFARLSCLFFLKSRRALILSFPMAV